mmetsp:Transcript_6121/g.19277  ORF Transcript_6121/g.19277 Transcript_6121/m.19277 type:complete len:342 (-) Transcript_6121:223-1248(-)
MISGVVRLCVCYASRPLAQAVSAAAGGLSAAEQRRRAECALAQRERRAPSHAKPGHVALGGGDAWRAVCRLRVAVPAAASSAAGGGAARPGRAVVAGRRRRPARHLGAAAGAVGAAVLWLHKVPRHLPAGDGQADGGAAEPGREGAAGAARLHHHRPRPRRRSPTQGLLWRGRVPRTVPPADGLVRGGAPRVPSLPRLLYQANRRRDQSGRLSHRPLHHLLPPLTRRPLHRVLWKVALRGGGGVEDDNLDHRVGAGEVLARHAASVGCRGDAWSGRGAKGPHRGSEAASDPGQACRNRAAARAGQGAGVRGRCSSRPPPPPPPSVPRDGRARRSARVRPLR